MTELESTLHSIITKLDGTTRTAETTNGAADDAAQTLTQLRADLLPPTPATSSVSASSPETRLDSAPVLSLFNNSILSRCQDDDEDQRPATPSIPESEAISKLEPTRRALLALFPSQTTLTAILDESQAWWYATQAMFPEIYGPECGSSIHQFIADSKASGSVQKITKALLCIVIGLQEAPPNMNLDLRPSKNIVELTTKYMNVIDEVVISNDELVGTIDGIECLYLYAKIEMNNGRIRRTWISTRRAMSFAQLLGFHMTQNSARASSKTQAGALRGQSLWKALYHTDRFVSLLLGLPYAAPDIPCTMPNEGAPAMPDSYFTSNAYAAVIPLTERPYLLKLASIIGHVIDRNQSLPSEDTLPQTVKVEGELTALAAWMPSSWWDLKNIPKEDVPDQLYIRLLPQFWHHQTRTLLHLPFMLRAATDRRYEYNRIAALESAREMVQTYIIFRPSQGFSSCVCKVVDFQVFTAAMVLVLNLLSTSQSSSARDQEDAVKDEELVTITHDLLHRASLETEGGVTTQAARALKMFCRARADRCPADQKSARLVIPYFGSVIFEPGKSFQNPSYLSACNQPPVQLPTPENSSLDSALQTPANNNFLAPMPSDYNFGGYPIQQPQSLGDGEMFANVNLDLDQDWSWFWDNTTMS